MYHTLNNATQIHDAEYNKSHLIALNGIAFLLTMLIMLLTTSAAGRHPSILAYQLCGEVWPGARLDIKFSFLSGTSCMLSWFFIPSFFSF